jgi:hypothetical protein
MRIQFNLVIHQIAVIPSNAATKKNPAFESRRERAAISAVDCQQFQGVRDYPCGLLLESFEDTVLDSTRETSANPFAITYSKYYIIIICMFNKFIFCAISLT